MERNEELVDSELGDATINEIIHVHHLQEEGKKIQADRRRVRRSEQRICGVVCTQPQLGLSPAPFLYLNGIRERPGGGAGLCPRPIKPQSAMNVKSEGRD